MRILVRKMSNLGLLKVKMIVGTLVMAAGFLGLPIGIFAADFSLITNPHLWMVIGGGMLFFGLVGFFGFIRPYILYNKLPEVQAEADDEYLYIHSKKEAKIPLSDITVATAEAELPYIYQKEFLDDILIHHLSEKYGKVILEIEGYGTYKMFFVSHAETAANELIYYINEMINRD